MYLFSEQILVQSDIWYVLLLSIIFSTIISAGALLHIISMYKNSSSRYDATYIGIAAALLLYFILKGIRICLPGKESQVDAILGLVHDFLFALAVIVHVVCSLKRMSIMRDSKKYVGLAAVSSLTFVICVAPAVIQIISIVTPDIVSKFDAVNLENIFLRLIPAFSVTWVILLSLVIRMLIVRMVISSSKSLGHSKAFKALAPDSGKLPIFVIILFVTGIMGIVITSFITSLHLLIINDTVISYVLVFPSFFFLDISKALYFSSDCLLTYLLTQHFTTKLTPENTLVL